MLDIVSSVVLPSIPGHSRAFMLALNKRFDVIKHLNCTEYGFCVYRYRIKVDSDIDIRYPTTLKLCVYHFGLEYNTRWIFTS